MKKIHILLIISIFILGACKNGNQFTLKGEVSNLTVDTIFVFYQEPSFKLDTIIANDGKFSYSIPTDTLTIFSIILNRGHEIPIFADKGEKVKISGSIDNLSIDGEADNKKLNDILIQESKMGKDSIGMYSWIDNFIKENPTSYACIYLIDKYYVRKSNPDYLKIDKLVAILNGNVKDTPYMSMLQKKLTELNLQSKFEVINTISVPDKNGVFPKWDMLKNKYTLINVWASWDEESKIVQDSLISIKKEFGKNSKFQLVSISLDIDRQDWTTSLPKDSTEWKQLCDFRGWDNNFIKQQRITSIPYNILVGPDKKIITTNIYGDKLKKKLRELLQDKTEKKSTSKIR